MFLKNQFHKLKFKSNTLLKLTIGLSFLEVIDIFNREKIKFFIIEPHRSENNSSINLIKKNIKKEEIEKIDEEDVNRRAILEIKTECDKSLLQSLDVYSKQEIEQNCDEIKNRQVDLNLNEISKEIERVSAKIGDIQSTNEEIIVNINNEYKTLTSELHETKALREELEVNLKEKEREFIKTVNNLKKISKDIDKASINYENLFPNIKINQEWEEIKKLQKEYYILNEKTNQLNSKIKEVIRKHDIIVNVIDNLNEFYKSKDEFEQEHLHILEDGFKNSIPILENIILKMNKIKSDIELKIDRIEDYKIENNESFKTLFYINLYKVPIYNIKGIINEMERISSIENSELYHLYGEDLLKEVNKIFNYSNIYNDNLSYSILKRLKVIGSYSFNDLHIEWESLKKKIISNLIDERRYIELFSLITLFNMKHIRLTPDFANFSYDDCKFKRKFKLLSVIDYYIENHNVPKALDYILKLKDNGCKENFDKVIDYGNGLMIKNDLVNILDRHLKINVNVYISSI